MTSGSPGACLACGPTATSWASGWPGPGRRPARPATRPRGRTFLGWTSVPPVSATTRPSGFLNRAKVMMGSGPHFGPGGAGFARLNFATTPGLLEETLSRVADALANIPMQPAARANVSGGGG